MAEENLVEGIEADDVYVGNGVAREFPITFTFSNESEVAVFLNGQVIRRGYKVEDGNVVFTIAPANGDVVSILKIDLSGYIKEDEVREVEEETETNTNTNVHNQASQEHIKINPVQTKVKYTGNGVVYEFPTIFAFFEDDNVVVYLNGVILNGGYSVTGVGETDGGLVIFDTPPAEGDKIVILRKVVVERVTDFQEGGSFRAKNINDEFDRMTAFCQQIEEEISRCVKVEVTDDQDPKELIDKVFDQLDLATEVGEQAIKTAQETQELVEGSKALIEQETQTAIENLSVASEGYIEKSRIWAEGEQAEVQELGGNLSSRGFADFAYAMAYAPEDVPVDQSGMIAMNLIKGDKGDAGTDGEDGKDGAGIEIGDIGVAVFGIDESKNLRRYLNGQIILQEHFESFTKIVKEKLDLFPGLFATEENWQAEVTNSKLGQCGKFVVNDEAGTIRLPKVVNINGLQDLSLMGSIKYESLPTHRHQLVSVYEGNVGNGGGTHGFINAAGTSTSRVYTDTDYSYAGNIYNNSTYQDNAPVQQEAIQYPYFIQVATAQEATIDVSRELQLNNPFFFGMSQYFESDPKNASWLLSDGSFYSGNVYKSFYEWLVKEYNHPDCMPNKINVKTSGGVSIVDGVARIPDLNSVITLPRNFHNSTKSWEILLKIRTSDDVTSTQTLVGRAIANQFSLQVYIQSGVFGLNLSGNGTTWNIKQNIEGGSVSPNTEYWVKTYWNGSTYGLEYSTNGISYTSAITVSSTTAMYSGVLFYLGSNLSTSGGNANLFLGELDLNKSIITIGGELYWRGVSKAVNKVSDIYTDYDYVIDSSNGIFRLPLKTNLAAGGAVVGNGMTLGLTNGSNNYGLNSDNGGNANRQLWYGGVYGASVGTAASGSYDATGSLGVTTDPLNSGIETSTNGLKLYFYVGETIQDANLIVATGIINEINNKLGRNEADYVTETYTDENGNWYRVYKSGWIEQGGTANGSVNYWDNQLNFIKPMANNKYAVLTSSYILHKPTIRNKTTTGFQVIGQEATDRTYTSAFSGDWMVCGQGA